MKIFSPTKLSEQMEEASLSQAQLVRSMACAVLEGSTLKPNLPSLRNTLSGESIPGGEYLGLLSEVLGCSVDDLFEEVESKT